MTCSIDGDNRVSEQFPHYGDESCEHPRKERKDVRYAVICKLCGAMKGVGGIWRVRR